MQTDLFETQHDGHDDNQGPELLLLDPGGISYVLLYRGFYASDLATKLFNILNQEVPWREDRIRIAGKTLPVPRLQAWFGNTGADYSYSGIRLTPVPLSSTLGRIKQDIEGLGDSRDGSQIRYNSLLANLYRHSNDSVGWHSDDEKELGQNPVIASLSLGGSRRFSLKPRNKSRRPLHLELHNGDVLIMGGETQHHWLHQVPKMRTAVTPRINLTFRKIHVK